jgi:hypothetical protein
MSAGGTCSAGSFTNTMTLPRDRTWVSDPHGLTNAILLTHLVQAARNQARGLVALGANSLAVAMPEAR